MPTADNKALVHRGWEAFNKRNWAGFEEDCAPDYVVHGTGVFPDMDLAGNKQLVAALWTAFPDMLATVEDVIAEGDKVVGRVTLRGTHQGEFMGIPPTGKQVSMTAIGIDRIKDGKFVESWWNEDDLGF